MSKLCCICKKPFESGGESYTLTKEEKITEQAPDELHYCSACLKIMKNRESGAQLLKGLYEMQLRESGVNSNIARRMAQRLYAKLIELSKPKNLH
jgi:hypothetical protein